MRSPRPLATMRGLLLRERGGKGREEGRDGEEGEGGGKNDDEEGERGRRGGKRRGRACLGSNKILVTALANKIVVVVKVVGKHGSRLCDVGKNVI